MEISKTIAKHLRDLYFGGNWTVSSFKQHLEDVTLTEALTEIQDLNTIAKLVYHSNYYVEAIIRVLNDKPIDAKDEFSFDHPNFTSESEWENFKRATLANIEDLANLVEDLNDEDLERTFVDEKYGTYYRNLHGVIEHSHYHLGQIVILKKLVRKK